jgi:hypothetical protein
MPGATNIHLDGPQIEAMANKGKKKSSKKFDNADF